MVSPGKVMQPIIHVYIQFLFLEKTSVVSNQGPTVLCAISSLLTNCICSNPISLRSHAELQDFRADFVTGGRWVTEGYTSQSMINPPFSGPQTPCSTYKQNASHSIPGSPKALSHSGINPKSKMSPKSHLRQTRQ